MKNKSIEICAVCGEPTGRAGRLDDSLYLPLVNDSGEEYIEIGPVCELCYRQLNIKDLIEENELLKKCIEEKNELPY